MALPNTGPISVADFNADAGFAAGTEFNFGGYDIPIELSHVHSARNQANQTTYTFSSVPFGDAHATRRILVAVMLEASGTTSVLATITIGGVAATLVGSQVNIVTNALSVRFFHALVPTGTSGSVVVTASRASRAAAISVYRATHATVEEAKIYNPAGESKAPGTFVDVDYLGTAQTGDIMLGAAAGMHSASHTWTWTNGTEDYDEVGTEFCSLTTARNTSPGTDQIMTATASASLTRMVSTGMYLRRIEYRATRIVANNPGSLTSPFSFSELRPNKSAKPYAAYCWVVRGADAGKHTAYDYMETTPFTAEAPHNGRTGRGGVFSSGNVVAITNTAATSGQRLRLFDTAGVISGMQVNFGDGVWRTIPAGSGGVHDFDNTTATTINTLLSNNRGNYLMIEIREAI